MSGLGRHVPGNGWLEEIDNRALLATAGPWRASGDTIVLGTSGGTLEGSAVRREDVEFIACARDDVPALLGELRALTSRADWYEHCAEHLATRLHSAIALLASVLAAEGELPVASETPSQAVRRAIAWIENTNASAELARAIVARAANREIEDGGPAQSMEPTSLSWAQPVCEVCWSQLRPGRTPARLPGRGHAERCSFCGGLTKSRIRVRENPSRVPYPHPAEEVDA